MEELAAGSPYRRGMGGMGEQRVGVVASQHTICTTCEQSAWGKKGLIASLRNGNTPKGHLSVLKISTAFLHSNQVICQIRTVAQYRPQTSRCIELTNDVMEIKCMPRDQLLIYFFSTKYALGSDFSS